ncbi:hypothetical protein [Streptomyces coerulescens]|uniref:hypothetical protein n=1 Tax=Streptomyces coerulescens TaxID=29304 RepID=UPI003AA926D4
MLVEQLAVLKAVVVLSDHAVEEVALDSCVPVPVPVPQPVDNYLLEALVTCEDPAYAFRPPASAKRVRSSPISARILAALELVVRMQPHADLEARRLCCMADQGEGDPNSLTTQLP